MDGGDDMDTNNEMSAPAESFSAVVAIAIPAGCEDFNPNLATYSGSGMGRTHDD